ncbi:hypothetical protein [uncultured Microbacterium sp.]|uniref:hypothetical protein n=1 Tax=uncultured Microbacterium sp. TaxID=191216 RepID=UPI0035CA3639
MIAFITSIRHPDNSASYSRVENLLEDTLRSVAGQVDQDFVVIVVGNRAPSFPLPERTVFVPVDFPAPAPPTGPRTARAPFVWDKGTKIGVGLIAARSYSPDFVMIFDADDFVSRRLSGFVKDHADCQGWVIEKGWMYSGSRGVFRMIPRFNRTCGTSFILPFDAYSVPSDVGVGADQQTIAAAYGELLFNIMGAHRDAVEWHEAHGRNLQVLPFRGAVYHVDTGENHSGKSMTGIAFPATRALLREFGIRDSRSLVRRAWSSFGPRPISETSKAVARRAIRR